MKSIILLALACTPFFLPSEQKEVLSNKSFQETDLRVEAHKILVTKCNDCHQNKNRYNVYTLENMDSFGVDIYKQVFIKKRMPKGKKNNLTQEEYDQLEEWLLGLEAVELKYSDVRKK